MKTVQKVHVILHKLKFIMNEFHLYILGDSMRFDVFFGFSLDPEQKEMLVEVIEKLLADKTTVSTIFFSKIHTALINFPKI